jgi:hypothetical protein
MNGAQSHTRFGREDCIVAMALTRDERRVLRYLASGRSTEEIAAVLNSPLQAVGWTSTHTVIAWVLDELEASSTPADSPPPRKQTGMKDAALTAIGRAIGLVSSAILFLVMIVVGGAIVLGFAQALGFFWRILTDG